MEVHTVNINLRTSHYQCGILPKKNPIMRIFCISGCLAVPINPDKWVLPYSEEYLSHCHFVHHKSHMDYMGSKPGLHGENLATKNHSPVTVLKTKII